MGVIEGMEAHQVEGQKTNGEGDRKCAVSMLSTLPRNS